MATMLALLSSPAVAQATTPAPANPQAATSPKAPAVPGAATTPVSTTKPRTRHKKTSAVAEVPQTPPPPPTLEQQPPTTPQVSYRNGQLTIDAPNSTLSSILRAVQVQTGASMDVPSAAGSERVAMHLGPGQPRDILHTLLNGSKFDYMILGVAGNPGAIQRVILTPKQAAGTTAQASNNPPPASEDADYGSQVADTGGESEYPGPTPEQPPMPPGAIRRPIGAPGAQQFNRPGDNPFPSGQADNVVKTPEQLMQELQEMQQQQQQYQEQLNPANQNPQQ